MREHARVHFLHAAAGVKYIPKGTEYFNAYSS